jgi:hypothetical protein
MDKLDENDHPIAFIPKAMINVRGIGRSSGSPCFLRPSHPGYSGQWQEFQKVLIKAYSCGYSSGFTPDSLLFLVGILTNSGTISEGKSRNYLPPIAQTNTDKKQFLPETSHNCCVNYYILRK